MKIPLVEMRSEDPDRSIIAGEHMGSPCYYKTGLLNTLIALKPKVCLEIGTLFGGTAWVFQEYFDGHMPDGVLVTADVKQYVDLQSPNAFQAIVYPHSVDVIARHSVVPDELLDGSEAMCNESVERNVDILTDWLHKVGVGKYDFAFIDADHARLSLLKDIEIATRLTSLPHYMLLDDTKEGVHEVSVVYKDELVSKYSTYDFEDWPVFVGASLIWAKSEAVYG